MAKASLPSAKPIEILLDIGFTFAIYIIAVILLAWFIPKAFWILGPFTPWFLAPAAAWPAWKWSRRTLWIK